MPFTGDSSDSESDGGCDGNIRSISGARGDNADKSHTPKTRGINPTIINQPPTPLLSRKKHPVPCDLGHVQDRVTGHYDNSVASFNPESPAFLPKTPVQKFDANLTSLSTAQSKLYNTSNTNTNSFQEPISPLEVKASSVSCRACPNGFTPSSRCSAKTPTRCAMIASPSKKLGTFYCVAVRRKFLLYNPCRIALWPRNCCNHLGSTHVFNLVSLLFRLSACISFRKPY